MAIEGEQKERYSGKKCFVALPIGADDTPDRINADALIDVVLNPILGEQLGFEIEVAHRMSDPGSISDQVIDRVLNADLVVANLTGGNPNVMYELGVRHAAGKPVVCLFERGTALPFDITQERAIEFENRISGVKQLKTRLIEVVDSAMTSKKPDNPVYRVLKAKAIQETIEPGSKDEFILEQLGQLARAIEALKERIEPRHDVRRYLVDPSPRQSYLAGHDIGFPDKLAGSVSDLHSSVEVRGRNE